MSQNFECLLLTNTLSNLNSSLTKISSIFELKSIEKEGFIN